MRLRLSFAFILAGIMLVRPMLPSQESITDFADLGRQVIVRSGISHGVACVLGCPDPAFAVGMVRSSGLLVHVLEPDRAKVLAARSAAEKGRIPIQRLLIERAPGDFVPHADSSIDLVVVMSSTDDPLARIPIAETLRVLRPLGKLAVIASGLGTSPGALSRLARQLEAAGFERTVIERDRATAWILAPKPPLPGVDTWSHWQHSPDNNPVSTDAVIRAPYMTQWLGEPYYIAMPAITTVAGGHTFIAMGHIAHHEREEPWLNTLLARNGYNGAELWRRKLPDGYLVHRSAFIATDDVFYMIDLDGDDCLMLDPETGKEKGRIRIPEIEGEWKWMALDDGTLFVLAGGQKDPPETTLVRSERTHWSWNELSRGYYAERVPWGFGTTLVAYDVERKRTLWTHTEPKPIDSRAMTVGGGKLFLYSPDARIACLDRKTGDLVWENTDPKVRALIEQPGGGLVSTPGFRTSCICLYTPPAIVYQAQTHMNVVAVSTDDGRFLWSRRKTTNNPNMLFADDKLHVGIGPEGSTLALDPLTGDVLKDLGFAKRLCARLTATPDSLFCRGMPDGLTRYDRATGKVFSNGAVRPACNDGVIGASGLLYIGPWLCDCNLSLMGTLSLCSAGDFAFDQTAAEAERLETGEGDIPGVAPMIPAPGDWPVYRGDDAHSGHTEVPVVQNPVDVWMYEPEMNYLPTAPVAAGDRVFLAGDDGKVRALDVRTGLTEWTFQTAGPIMQPPTIWNGRAYVGSGDGFIYALEAATGRLLWRFRAAPVERRIMVYGSLCSTWPVNSGVLVADGVAYAAAGIIDYDGTYVYALDAETGRIRWQNCTSDHLDPELRKGVSAQGNLTIASGRLWMPGGNVVSPACYDLGSGTYLGPGPRDGSPDANRGEEIGVFQNNYLLFGGRLRYSAIENVVNPGNFEIAEVTPEGGKLSPIRLFSGRIPAAWDADRVLFVPSRLHPPSCFRAADVVEYIQGGDSRRAPSPLWTIDLPENGDVVSVALAPNAALAVYSTRSPGPLGQRWTISTFEPNTGTPLWKWTLPSEPLPGGLLVDRFRHIIVVLRNGGLVCFGDVGEIPAQIARLEQLTGENRAARDQAIRKLNRTLSAVQDPEPRHRLVETLAQLGVSVGSASMKQGFIADWEILGPVPWDRDRVPEQTLVEQAEEEGDAPAIAGTETLSWRRYLTELPSGQVDLVRIFGESPDTAMYACAEVRLPAARDLLLKIGSDDGVTVWFNGELLGRNEVQRGWVPDQDVHPVRGRAGVNTVLLKVTQIWGGWAFSVRVTDPDGSPLDLTATPGI